MHDKDKSMHDNSGYHLIVLAKNYTGYKNLIKLVSNAWVDGYYYRPRTDREQLEKYHEGTDWCVRACIAAKSLTRLSMMISRVQEKLVNGIIVSSEMISTSNCNVMK